MRDAHIWSQGKKCSRSRCACHRSYTSAELTDFYNGWSFSLATFGRRSISSPKERIETIKIEKLQLLYFNSRIAVDMDR